MMVWSHIIGILVAISVCLSRADERRLNDYVTHYESLNYDSQELHSHHLRVKRSLTDPHLHLTFKAHGRVFKLRLSKDTSTFSPDFKLINSNGELVDHDTSYIYKGTVWGEPNTDVHGSIIGGVFAGTIRTPRETYYVERAQKYFDDNSEFHSIIYADKDVVVDPKSIRLKRAVDGGSPSCGLNNADIMKEMDHTSHSATGKVDLTMHEDASKSGTSKKKRSAESRRNIYSSYKENIWSKEANQRHRRETNTNRRTCTLFLQSDTILWDQIFKRYNKNQVRAQEEITSMFAEHVDALKSIYENTVFDTYPSSSSRYSYTGISFVVRRIKINMTDVDCPKGAGTPNAENPFCKPNIDVSNFLNYNSLSNHNDFCLAYIFTYRDFTGGTLGLAWVGSPSRASGGICERWKENNENGKKVWKSLNTGVVTLVNYNQKVPTKVSSLTFAHEVGHNFGAPHDNGGTCTPLTSNRDVNGNYIMFASATAGDRPNNDKFSICSKDNITLVLNSVFNELYGKYNCFVEPEAAFCGNNIVEEGEQCDCGYKDDCKDSCCNPRDTEGDNKLWCKLKGNAACSPTAGPCCYSNCTKVPSERKMQCKSEADCNAASFCNGINETCPSPAPKPNNTVCNDNAQICLNGECRGSICQTIGWNVCYLTAPKNDKTFDRGLLCFVSCQKDPTSPCISSKDENLQKDYPEMYQMLTSHSNGNPIKLPAGAPCDNFQGYCDVFHKCRGVDADGPLARLKKLLFNEQTFNEIRDWIVTHWWAVLLMVLGLIILMALFIKICAVHTPSSNPKKKPARKLTLRPQSRNQQGFREVARHDIPQGRAGNQYDSYGGPPPPYSAGQSSRGGPPHGRGHGRGKDGQGRGGQKADKPGRTQAYEMRHQRV